MRDVLQLLLPSYRACTADTETEDKRASYHHVCHLDHLPVVPFLDTWGDTPPRMITFIFNPTDGTHFHDTLILGGRTKTKSGRKKEYETFRTNLLRFLPPTATAGIYEFKNVALQLGHAVAVQIQRQPSEEIYVWDSAATPFFGRGATELGEILQRKELIVPPGGWVCTGLTVVCRTDEEVAGFKTPSRARRDYRSDASCETSSPPVTAAAGLPTVRSTGGTDSVAQALEWSDAPPRSQQPAAEASTAVTPTQAVAAGLPSRRESSVRDLLSPAGASLPSTPSTIGRPTPRTVEKLARFRESLSPKHRETMDHVFDAQKHLPSSGPHLVQAGLWCWLCSNAYLGYVLNEVAPHPPLLMCQSILLHLYDALMCGDVSRLPEHELELLMKALTEDVSYTGKDMAGGMAWRLLMRLELSAQSTTLSPRPLAAPAAAPAAASISEE